MNVLHMEKKKSTLWNKCESRKSPSKTKQKIPKRYFLRNEHYRKKMTESSNQLLVITLTICGENFSAKRYTLKGQENTFHLQRHK